MRTRVLFASLLVLSLSLAMGGVEAGAANKKIKGQKATAGAAGARSSAKQMFNRPGVIDNGDALGVYCSTSAPNVHQLGTLPAGMGVQIDFESDETSDPIAILTTLKMDGTDVGAENGASDDDGGDLNPRFEVRRPYKATYILTVGSADGDEACYAFRVRWVQ